MVEEVVFLEVIRDVYVHAAVAVDISRDDAEAIAKNAPVNSRRFADVHEMAAVVPIEPRPGPWVSLGAGGCRSGAALGMERAVEHKQVQVPIAVVFEAHRLGRIAGKIT